MSPGYLSTKTDSQGIIRLVQRVKQSSSKFNRFYKPLLYVLFNLCAVGYGIWTIPFYQDYSFTLCVLLGAILVHYVLMCLFGYPGK